MTDEPTPKAETPSVAPSPAVRDAIPANPALVEFPRDVHGFTSDLRQALLTAASNIRADKDKHRVFLETLRVGAGHAIARFKKDEDAKQAELDDEEARIARVNRTGRIHVQAAVE